MSIEQRQRALVMLPREIFLPRREIGVREIAVGVGRVGIGEQNEFVDLDRRLHIARPLIVRTDDARRDLGEELGDAIVQFAVDILPDRIRQRRERGAFRKFASVFREINA